MLDELADYYQKKQAAGCIAWWEKQPIDQFQKNNDTLEQMIPNLGFDDASEHFYTQHLERQKELIDYYLANRKELPKYLDASDSFIMTKLDSNKDDFAFLETAHNQIDLACSICGAKKNLRSVTDYENNTIEYFCKGQHNPETHGYKPIYDGDETTEQRFAEYVARKKFEEKEKPLESPTKHKLEHDILFSNNYTSDIKKEKLEEWRKIVIDEKDANKMWDDL